jgi:Fe-S cluster assembly protein SufD
VLDTDVELGGRTVALDSQPLHAELKTQWAEQGVVFTNLHEAACEHGDLVKRYLMTGAPAPSYDKFAALHTACFAGGTFLYVPPGVCVDQPLHALSALSDGGVDLGHLLIVVDDDAEATVLSETVSTSQEAAGLHCGGIEILLAPRARLRYVNLQNWSPRVWHFAHQNAALGSQAALQWTIGALGGRLAKVNQHVMLKGEHARAQVNGVMFAEQKQHLAYHTLQHHEAAACHSDLLYKGALQDRATILWRGMIKVDPDAQQTDAYQRDDNLVLSDAARADSIPGLEIEADDVRCSHGATVGRVDDDEIFYALTRGFTRNEAVRMIVAGFFQQVFDRISIESVRDSLGRAIGERIREYA